MSFPSFNGPVPRGSLDPSLLGEDEVLDLSPEPTHLYHAGEIPPPGLYRQLDGWRSVEIREGERLPASLDGHVAYYRRVERLWGQIG